VRTAVQTAKRIILRAQIQNACALLRICFAQTRAIIHDLITTIAALATTRVLRIPFAPIHLANVKPDLISCVLAIFATILLLMGITAEAAV
jgi:hypothetical protein